MSEEELIKTLRAFEKNRVEQLEEPARNLFYAIMKIAGERDRLNNIIEKIRDYVYKPIDKEWGDILCIIEDGLRGSDYND